MLDIGTVGGGIRKGWRPSFEPGEDQELRRKTDREQGLRRNGVLECSAKGTVKEIRYPHGPMDAATK